MKGPRCPTCKKPLPETAERAAFPFCSMRCKTIDLGAWLDERYRMATDEASDEDANDDLGGT